MRHVIVASFVISALTSNCCIGQISPTGQRVEVDLSTAAGNQVKPENREQIDVQDPCLMFRRSFAVIISEATRYDYFVVRDAIAALGVPSESEPTPGGGKKYTYRWESCTGEITLDSGGFARSAVLAADPLSHPRTVGPRSRAGVDIEHGPVRPGWQPRPVLAQPATKQPETISRSRKALVWTLVVVGAGAAVYGGYKAGLGGGRCNSPSDRASDGSRCGGRAASVR